MSKSGQVGSPGENSHVAASVTADLKKLRLGQGLTVSALEARPNLVEALGVGSAAEARRKIVALLTELPEGRPRQALLAAYGFEVPPVGDGHADRRKKGILKERRIDYGSSISVFEPRSVIRYEDRAILELAALILDRQEEPSHLHLYAEVGPTKRFSSIYSYKRGLPWSEGGFPTGPSIPALIFQIPQGEVAESLAFTITWPMTIVPEGAWAYTASSLLEVMTPSIRKLLYLPGLDVINDPVRSRERYFIQHEFGKPQTGLFYIVAWQYYGK